MRLRGASLLLMFAGFAMLPGNAGAVQAHHVHALADGGAPYGGV